MKNFIFIVVCIGVFSFLTFSLYIYFSCGVITIGSGSSALERAIVSAGIIVQSVGILVAGFWAYRKFGWEMKVQNAIEIKAALMEYHLNHGNAAMQYRIDVETDEAGAWARFATTMIPYRNRFFSQFHLAIYLPSRVRNELMEIVFLSLNKGSSPKKNDIDKNWKQFESRYEAMEKTLDKIVDL